VIRLFSRLRIFDVARFAVASVPRIEMQRHAPAFAWAMGVPRRMPDIADGSVESR
jgi:hypothetical protein